MTNWYEFDEKRSDDFPILVTDIRTDAAANKAHNTVQIKGLPGAVDVGIDEDMKLFDIDVVVSITSSLSLQDIKDRINAWLRTKGLARFRTGREPGRIYEVRHIGKLEWNPVGNALLKTTISFVAPYPRSTGSERFESLSATGTTVIYNNGNAATSPVMKVNVKAPITSLSFIKNNEYVSLGYPENVEFESVPAEEYALRDGLESTEGWSTTSYIDGGTVTGAFRSSGTGFVVDDYGTGTGWHGPAISKALDIPTEDFRAQTSINLRCTSPDQVGRIEMYVLDANNAIIGKVAMKDITPNEEKNMGEIRVGNIQHGTYLMSGERKGAKYAWNDFNGVMRIERRNGRWRGYFGQQVSSGKFEAQQTTDWFDNTDTRFDGDAAKIVFHIAQNGTHPTPSYIYFGELTVKRYNDVTTTEIPVIADVGDVIEIDFNDNMIYKNGEEDMTLHDPLSQYFDLEPGENTILHTPANAVDVEVSYVERWL